MTADKKTPFERAVTQIASKQPELQPKPFKPEMRSDRMWYELQAALARIAECERLLTKALTRSAIVHPGFADEIRALLAKD